MHGCFASTSLGHLSGANHKSVFEKGETLRVPSAKISMAANRRHTVRDAYVTAAPRQQTRTAGARAISLVLSLLGHSISYSWIILLLIILHGEIPVGSTKAVENAHGVMVQVPIPDDTVYWYWYVLFIVVSESAIMFLYGKLCPDGIHPTRVSANAANVTIVFTISQASFMIGVPLLFKALGASNLVYNSFRGIPFIVSSVLFVVGSIEPLARKYFAKNRNPGLSIKRKRGQRRGKFSMLAQMLGITTIGFYSLFVIPLFLWANDPGRLFIVCILFPVLNEGFTTILRKSKRAKWLRTVARLETELSKEAFAEAMFLTSNDEFVFQVIFAFVRRCLLSMMHSNISTTVGVLLSGVQEVAFRSSLVARDSRFARLDPNQFTFKNEKNKVLVESSMHDVWIVSICRSMIAEVVAILCRYGAMMSLGHLSFMYDLGGTSSITSSAFGSFNVAMEIGFEVLVDVSASVVEMRYSGIDLEKFHSCFLTWRHTAFDFLVVCRGIFTGLVLVTNLPNPMFCDLPENPCTCDAFVFPAYADLCAANSSVILPDAQNATTLSSLSESDITALAISAISFVAVVSLLGLHAARAQKRAALKKVAAEMATLKKKLRANNRSMSKNQQQAVESRMRLTNEKLKAYCIPRDHITLEECIGQGSSGEVWRGLLRKTQTVAIKKIIIHPGKSTLRSFFFLFGSFT